MGPSAAADEDNLNKHSCTLSINRGRLSRRGVVLEGKQDRSAAAVAIQALNGARGCLVGALKAREQEELARELEELKSYVQDQEVSRWRA
jgi:hypothetical protein